MSLVVGFAHSAAVKVTDVAFLLFAIAGIWIAVAALIPVEKTHLGCGFIVVGSSRFRVIVAGILLAAGGVLLIVATRWGHLFA
jgi:hypothetical protein